MALPALVLDEQQDVGQGEAGVALSAREEVLVALGSRGRGHREQAGGILGVLGEVGCHRLSCTRSRVKKTQVNSSYLYNTSRSLLQVTRCTQSDDLSTASHFHSS